MSGLKKLVGFCTDQCFYKYRSNVSFILIRSVTGCSNNNSKQSSHDCGTSRFRCRTALAVTGSILCVSSLAYFANSKKYLDIPRMFPPVSAAVFFPGDADSGGSSARKQFNFIADIVEKNASALVCIEIKDTARLDYFFRGVPNMTNGSGFIIEEDGLILTNAHVVMGHPHSVVQVRLSDGRVYPARIEDIDVSTDLATLRIKPEGRLPIMKLGSSKGIRPGEWVIAMGSPLSLSNTITAGIVSSVSRTSSELGLYGRDMDYIQTDAAITFGNSGGPLVNLDGEVVGINSMKVSAGISFAIPIDYAKEFLQRSKSKQATGKPAKRRYLGITMLTLTNDIIQELQARSHTVPTEVTNGVLVWKVIVGSPAYKAGLLPGDIIVEMNGQPLKSVNTVYRALEQFNVINLRVYRGNAYFEVTVFPEET